MMAAIGFREVPMRAISSVLLILSLGFGGSALAADEAQLVEAINAYRGQVQRCGALASPELPPLASDPRLVLPRYWSAISFSGTARSMSSSAVSAPTYMMFLSS
jgi:hypothetical protein